VVTAASVAAACINRILPSSIHTTCDVGSLILSISIEYVRCRRASAQQPKLLLVPLPAPSMSSLPSPTPYVSLPDPLVNPGATAATTHSHPTARVSLWAVRVWHDFNSFSQDPIGSPWMTCRWAILLLALKFGLDHILREHRIVKFDILN